MITHGNKQISEIVYARKASEGGGAVRLTNIIRGAQVVFGGLSPNVKWLKAATMQAILAAFGQDDGYAVLAATNAYLNALAATDQTKASALAGFINEDPMLVCSLGLQPQGVTMPIRWLVGDGTAWIRTDYYANSASDISVDFFQSITFSSWRALLGNRMYGVVMYVIFVGSNGWGLNYGSRDQGAIAGLQKNVKHNISNVGKLFYVDGEYKLDANSTLNGSIGPIDIFTSHNLTPVPIPIGTININENGSLVKRFVPFKLGKAREVSQVYPQSLGAQPIGTLGMLDTESGLFYPNYNSQGAFSISFTKNNVPWTPLNQTP